MTIEQRYIHHLKRLGLSQADQAQALRVLRRERGRIDRYKQQHPDAPPHHAYLPLDH